MDNLNKDTPDTGVSAHLANATSALWNDLDLGPAQKTMSDHLLNRALTLIAEANKILAEQRDRIEQLESLALTDELTALYNRRGYQELFRRELSRANRNPDTAHGVLMLLDLDHFKPINDKHGHLAGDACLKAVAEFLKKSVRETDIVARLGGDEFVVLLTSVDEENGFKRAQVILDQLNQAFLDWDGKRIPIHSSMGLSAYAAGSREDEIFTVADNDLYQKKGKKKPGKRHVA